MDISGCSSATILDVVEYNIYDGLHFLMIKWIILK